MTEEVIKRLEADAGEAEKLKEKAEREEEWSDADYEEGYADGVNHALSNIRPYAMDRWTYKCLIAVINYTYAGEKRHWEESDKPDDHIYHNIKRLRDFTYRQLGLEPSDDESTSTDEMVKLLGLQKTNQLKQ